MLNLLWLLFHILLSSFFPSYSVFPPSSPKVIGTSSSVKMLLRKRRRACCPQSSARFQEAGDGVESRESREIEKRLVLISVSYSKMCVFSLPQVFMETVLCSEPVIKH